MSKITFGVAGFPINFNKSKYKGKRQFIFDWLVDLGLDGLELQCTYGFRTSDETALLYRTLAAEKGIVLTVHAPYYINLGSKRVEVVENSKREIIKGFEFAAKVAAKKIIFHPGGGWGKTDEEREAGMERLINALIEIKKDIDTTSIRLCPEIGGKTNALGSLEEIIEICEKVDYARPCIDVAHYHARNIGCVNNAEDVLYALNQIEKKLGRRALEETHFHMYPVEYTEKGEKVHKMFSDIDESGQSYRPLAEHFVEAIKIKKLTPSIICEAHNSQEIGAALLKKLYFDS